MVLESQSQIHDHVKASRPHRGNPVGYSVAIIINIGLYYVANNFLQWNFRYIDNIITENWYSVLPIVSAAILVTIILNIIFLMYDQRTFFYIAKGAINVMALWALILMIKFFPFTFSSYDVPWLETVMRIGLYVGIIGIIIGFIVRTVKMTRGKHIHEK